MSGWIDQFMIILNISEFSFTNNFIWRFYLLFFSISSAFPLHHFFGFSSSPFLRPFLFTISSAFLLHHFIRFLKKQIAQLVFVGKTDDVCTCGTGEWTVTSAMTLFVLTQIIHLKSICDVNLLSKLSIIF